MPDAGGEVTTVEAADVVVVGARVAGCAVAIPLARAGRRVIVLDRASFPSNVLSTHGLWPGGVAQLARLGALQRVLALEPPKLRRLEVHHLGWHVAGEGDPIDGIDYTLCVGRPQLDSALQDTARAAGVEIRERTVVDGLVWDGSRAAGVRYSAARGAGPSGEIRARLVVGADGRRSTVAELVGEGKPYRGSRNGRGFAYWYMDDPKVGTPARESASLWRDGETLVIAGGMPDDRMIVVAVCPAADVALYRKDPEGMWERLLRQHRRLADRVAGATRPTRPFATADLPSFFRASSGPGWALAGDAGHFKDPVLAQGMRDALEFGRRLGEVAALVLGDPRRLDRALRDWERERDRACLSMYHWSNRESRVDPEIPLIAESLRAGSAAESLAFLSRSRPAEEIFAPQRAMLWLARALARPGADRRQILRQFLRDLPIEIDAGRERARDRFRPASRTASERPGWVWPPRRARARRESVSG